MKRADKWIALAVLSFLAASVAEAGERPGAQVRVSQKDGTQLSGELVAVRKASLVLLLNEPQANADTSVGVEDIEQVRISRKSHVALGIGVGLAVGLAAGLVIRPHHETCQNNFGGVLGACIVPGLDQFGGTMIIGLTSAAGTAIGAVVGAASGSDTVYGFRGMNASAVSGILQSLSRQARVRGIQ